MKRTAAAPLALAAVLLCGCAGNQVPAAWLDSDTQRLNTIGVEWQKYVENDPARDAAEKATAARSIEIWRAENEEHRSAVQAAGGQ